MEEQTLQELIETDMKLECSLVVIRTQDLPYIREELQRIARNLKHDICFWNYRKQFHNILSGSGVEVQLSDFLYDSLMDEEALQEVGRAIQAESRGFSQKEEEFPLTRESCVGELRDTEDYDVVFSWFTNASFQNPTILVVESSRLLFSSRDECIELTRLPSAGKTLIVLDDDIEDTTVAHSLCEYGAYHKIPTVERTGLVKVYSKICERYELDIPSREVQERIIRVLNGLTMDQARLLLTDVIRKNNFRLGESELPELFKERFSNTLSRTLSYVTETSEVGGLQQLMEWLDERRGINTQEAKDFGLQPVRGLILVGEPGTGKTAAAGAIARKMNLPLIEFHIERIFGKYLGETEGTLSESIRLIDNLGPCIVLLDELDKKLRIHSENHDATLRAFGVLLSWFSNRKSEALIIISCNRLNFPPELLRAGRFDGIFHIPLPHAQARKEIFAIHLAKRGHSLTESEIHEVAEMTNGFSGAEIEGVIQSALIQAYRRDKHLTVTDVIEAIKDTNPLSHTRAAEIAAYTIDGQRTGKSAAKEEEMPKIPEKEYDYMFA